MIASFSGSSKSIFKAEKGRVREETGNKAIGNETANEMIEFI